MEENKSKDIMIDTVHHLRAALDTCLAKIDAADNSDPDDPIINQVERELHKLNLETNKIYTEMIARAIESKETKELIESKKESTPEGG